jgi:LysR family hydrogen peroxide-inducible transcriptional activator
MVTLTQLKYIVAVHEEKHFGRAAKVCNVSQPSLSSQIQKVEELLETIFFDRSKKPVLTTEEGEVFVKRAKSILIQVEDLESLVLKSTEPNGVFKLGVIPTLAPYLVPLFLESFSKKYPKVNLKIFEKTTREIVAALREDSLDGGLLVTPLNDDQIIERVLFSEKLYVYASKGHPLSKRKKVSIKDLDGLENFWILHEGHCLRDQVLNLCSMDFKKTNIQFESGSIETVKELVRQGQGLTVVPELSAAKIKDSVIPFESPEPVRQVSLVHSRAFLKESILQSLEDEILKSLPKSVKNLKSGSVKVVPI